MSKMESNGQLNTELVIPELSQLQNELDFEKKRSRFLSTLRTTLFTLISVSAAAVLVATLWMPVLQIYGSSMEPTLEEGEIVVSVKGERFKHGDVIAFYYNNKILVKRVIATSGQWVDIDDNGYVSVNGELLDEPYITDRAIGNCDITFPYQVPDGRTFVLGDHRSVSLDSRSTSIGCVTSEQIVGKLTFGIWPLGNFGKIK